MESVLIETIEYSGKKIINSSWGRSDMSAELLKINGSFLTCQ